MYPSDISYLQTRTATTLGSGCGSLNQSKGWVEGLSQLESESPIALKQWNTMMDGYSCSTAIRERDQGERFATP